MEERFFDEEKTQLWLDKTLIDTCTRIAYKKEEGNLFFRVFAMFPEFMFHLRRSPFVRIFNSSPDETSYYRMILNRESVRNSLVMIKPRLYSYELMKSKIRVRKVPLDVSSIQSDCILMLDAYFTIVIFYGKDIIHQQKKTHEKQTLNTALAHLIQMVYVDAEAFKQKRFPTPF